MILSCWRFAWMRNDVGASARERYDHNLQLKAPRPGSCGSNFPRTAIWRLSIGRFGFWVDRLISLVSDTYGRTRMLSKFCTLFDLIIDDCSPKELKSFHGYHGNVAKEQLGQLGLRIMFHLAKQSWRTNSWRRPLPLYPSSLGATLWTHPKLKHSTWEKWNSSSKSCTCPPLNWPGWSLFKKARRGKHPNYG